MSEVDIYKHAKSLKEVPQENIAIEVSHLTKDYGKGRGIFDISFIGTYLNRIQQSVYFIIC